MSPFRHKYLDVHSFIRHVRVPLPHLGWDGTVFAQPPATLDVNQAKKDADFPVFG